MQWKCLQTTQHILQLGNRVAKIAQSAQMLRHDSSVKSGQYIICQCSVITLCHTQPPIQLSSFHRKARRWSLIQTRAHVTNVRTFTSTLIHTFLAQTSVAEYGGYKICRHNNEIPSSNLTDDALKLTIHDTPTSTFFYKYQPQFRLIQNYMTKTDENTNMFQIPRHNPH